MLSLRFLQKKVIFRLHGGPLAVPTPETPDLLGSATNLSVNGCEQNADASETFSPTSRIARVTCNATGPFRGYARLKLINSIMTDWD